MADDLRAAWPRRSFFSRFAAAGALLGIGAAVQPAAGAEPPPFQPARHPQDDWYDALPGKHRFFLDTVSPRGAGEGIAYATNFFTGSSNGYELADRDSAIVLCLRHQATPFAWTDAVWSKYGATIADALKFDDPKTGKAPVVNVYNTAGYGEALPNRNIPLETLAGRGVHFAVCALATRRHAGLIARAAGTSADEVFRELSSSMLPNAHLVPAGVVAVNRAQERGYTLMYVG